MAKIKGPQWATWQRKGRTSATTKTVTVTIPAKAKGFKAKTKQVTIPLQLVGTRQGEIKEARGGLDSPLANADAKSRGMRAYVPGFKCRLEMPDTERVQRFNQTAYNAGKFHKRGI